MGAAILSPVAKSNEDRRLRDRQARDRREQAARERALAVLRELASKAPDLRDLLDFYEERRFFSTSHAVRLAEALQRQGIQHDLRDFKVRHSSLSLWSLPVEARDLIDRTLTSSHRKILRGFSHGASELRRVLNVVRPRAGQIVESFVVGATYDSTRISEHLGEPFENKGQLDAVLRKGDEWLILATLTTVAHGQSRDGSYWADARAGDFVWSRSRADLDQINAILQRQRALIFARPSIRESWTFYGMGHLRAVEDADPVKITWKGLWDPSSVHDTRAPAGDAIDDDQKELDQELAAVEAGLPDDTFDPSDLEDARQRTLANIVRRQGQAQFRAALMSAYDGRCAITGCDVAEALEAAHIAPYLGPHTNTVNNGLLLRADVHTLFDLGRLAVSDGHAIVLARSLAGTTYEHELKGKRLCLPKNEALRPSLVALRQHRLSAGLDAVVVPP